MGLGRTKKSLIKKWREKNIHLFMQQLFIECSVCAVYCPEAMGGKIKSHAIAVLSSDGINVSSFP